jgi:ABC-type sugar transport system ATPase subunit
MRYCSFSNCCYTLRDQGVAILFISHRLDEVFEISDRITIFRDGKFISSALAVDVTLGKRHP